MGLNYLEFDYSEDTSGQGTFDVMASTAAEHVPAVHAEISMVLAWAFDHYPHARGPIEEGFVWDYDLQSQLEYTASQVVDFDPLTRQLTVRPHQPGAPRHTVTLSLTGSIEFCEALRQQFDLG